jgi:hypothetical protein
MDLKGDGLANALTFHFKVVTIFILAQIVFGSIKENMEIPFATNLSTTAISVQFVFGSIKE